MENITVNNDQELFVIKIRNGYTCLGFDVCLNRQKKLADELNIPLLPHERGSIESYRQYDQLIEIARQKHNESGFRWISKSELIPEFIGKEGKRVEVIDEYGEKRRFYIGKSTGFIPCHLEIKQRNSSGGGSITGYPFKSIRYIS